MLRSEQDIIEAAFNALQLFRIGICPKCGYIAPDMTVANKSLFYHCVACHYKLPHADAKKISYTYIKTRKIAPDIAIQGCLGIYERTS